MSLVFVPAKSWLRHLGVGHLECSTHGKITGVEQRFGCIACARDAFLKHSEEAREARITEIAEGVSRAIKENA